jgi:hypothetical protein
MVVATPRKRKGKKRPKIKEMIPSQRHFSLVHSFKILH